MQERDDVIRAHPASIPVLTRAGFWLAAWWVWFLVLFVFSSIPGTEMAKQPFQFNDKAQHTLYFLAGAFVLGAVEVARGRWPRRWWLLPLMAAVVGAFDETHQRFTPGRSVEMADWIADMLGGFLAIPVVSMWQVAVRRWLASRRAVAVAEPPCEL